MSWLLLLPTILASQQSWVNCIFYLVLKFVSDLTVEFRAAHRDQDYSPILLSSPHFLRAYGPFFPAHFWKFFERGRSFLREGLLPPLSPSPCSPDEAFFWFVFTLPSLTKGFYSLFAVLPWTSVPVIDQRPITLITTQHCHSTSDVPDVHLQRQEDCLNHYVILFLL